MMEQEEWTYWIVKCKPKVVLLLFFLRPRYISLHMYRSVCGRLQRLFPDLKATHQSVKACPKRYVSQQQSPWVVAVCPAEKTLKGSNVGGSNRDTLK
jgi:hypothetical protein